VAEKNSFADEEMLQVWMLNEQSESREARSRGDPGCLAHLGKMISRSPVIE